MISDIRSCLHSTNYSIDLHAVDTGRIFALANCGLQVVTICNDGTGRSQVAASTLTSKHDIPSVCISGGLRELTADENSHIFPYLLWSAESRAITLAVILTQQERLYYLKHLLTFPHNWYEDSDKALISLSKMKRI